MESQTFFKIFDWVGFIDAITAWIASCSQIPLPIAKISVSIWPVGDRGVC
jgi:hypothetical protein